MLHKRQRFEKHGPRFLKKERMDGEIMNLFSISNTKLSVFSSLNSKSMCVALFEYGEGGILRKKFT
jgi:hypothetical protein